MWSGKFEYPDNADVFSVTVSVHVIKILHIGTLQVELYPHLDTFNNQMILLSRKTRV